MLEFEIGRIRPPRMTRREKRLVALLSGTTLALLLACVVLGLRPVGVGGSFNTQAALSIPKVRDAIVRELISQRLDVWDSHSDAEVGRVMLPNLVDVMSTGVPVSTNAFGLRERPFEMPKPEGTLRVVLLGDSFIQGFGVEAEERVGALLERWLVEHTTGWKGQIECLHVAVGGWNVLSESTWIRRTLGELKPDLVVHVLITNDLDDHAGARGFGTLAAFAPLLPEQTDALVFAAYPCQFSSPRNTNYIIEGFDWESRHRYEALGKTIGELARLVEAAGGRYLAVSHWPGYHQKLWSVLDPELEPRQCIFLPLKLHADPALILAENDTHWSPAGHDLVSKLLFATIRQRELLPELGLSAWPEVEALARSELGPPQREALKWPPLWRWRDPERPAASLVPGRFTDAEWRQVYTGLDDEGRVSPFASFMLDALDKQTVRLRGRVPERPELAGARVHVSVEGEAVGECELVPGEAFDVAFPLPESIAVGESGCANVRLQSSDYVYAGPYLQHCISFFLDELALEPASDN